MLVNEYFEPTLNAVSNLRLIPLQEATFFACIEFDRGFLNGLLVLTSWPTDFTILTIITLGLG